ncbi:MAG: DUF2935 domain-containing protein [Thermincolia bacterium]
MLNELEEYVVVLKALLAGRFPVAHPVHYHLVWLLDGIGRAAAIAGRMDEVERKIIEKSQVFKNTFQGFYLKAVEMAGYLRTNVHRFPALERFNREVEGQMGLFMEFLLEIQQLRSSNRALGIL